MRPGLRIVAVALSTGLLAGCGEWKTDSTELTARTSAADVGMDCASCHGYPLKDKNHDYHLRMTGGNRDLNGAITCLDCHSRSIQSHLVTLFDSAYEDTSTTEKFHTLAHPGPDDTTSDGKRGRSLVLVEVDTLIQNHPIDAVERQGSITGFQEYVTGLAHLNHVVDVSFDPRDSRPDHFGGDSASYNPEKETCSAVACHPGPDKVYSWGSVRKSLPILKGNGPETE